MNKNNFSGSKSSDNFRLCKRLQKIFTHLISPFHILMYVSLLKVGLFMQKSPNNNGNYSAP